MIGFYITSSVEVVRLIRLRILLLVLIAASLSIVPGFAQTAPQEAQAILLSPAQLETLAGEYTDPHEPDTPISFYVQDGKLIVESERNVSTELKPISTTEFSWPHAKFTLRFILDAAGHGNSVIFSDTPNDTYRRTGEPVHHLFLDYQRT